MKPINEAAVTFLSRSANEGFARTAAACFVKAPLHHGSRHASTDTSS